MKKIYLKESQFREYLKFLLNEGSETFRSDDGNIGFRINNDMSDVANNAFDTRALGYPKKILHGDKTLINMHNTFSDTVLDAEHRIEMNKNAIVFVKNGFVGEIKNATESFVNKILKMRDNAIANGEDPQEVVMAWLEKNLERDGLMYSMYSNKYFRAKSSKPRQKIGRYNVGLLPDTNIPIIALFTISDFNYSDILKHGNARQNGMTDELLGIDKTQRATEDKYVGKGQAPYKRVPVTYDDGIQPDIASNFSLSNVSDGHFKDQYGYQSKNNRTYNSVQQFLDKSILTADYALKKEHFKPDFIVTAPSSSKFNHYYCTNLSNKLGVEYIQDFFKKNIINVVFDKTTEDDLTKCGATEQDKFKIRRIVLSGIYNEIGLQIKKTISNFILPYQDMFNNISKEFYSREKIDINAVISVLANDICTLLLKNRENSQTIVYKTIVQNFVRGEMNNCNTTDKLKHLRNELSKLIKLKVGQRNFQILTQQVDEILQFYNNKIEEGFNVNATQFKIAKIEKRFRKCLRNIYVIADKVLNKENQLYTRYKNAKFLVFDDDVNSGATLKLVCDALSEKLGKTDNNNIVCLANAYSHTGF